MRDVGSGKGPAIAFVMLRLLWPGAGDIFLKFALEDERFSKLATESRALCVFRDTELSTSPLGN
jgi:hypothetical protein